ncbi:MAG: 4Fe-4S dicluster domain-containing protein [Planctomycetia bacterium]|nr:4Fe-4S dicluster domain-containing protein [Planctomycetia bacterium]
METKLRETAKKLLEEKKVDVVIGYGRRPVGGVGAVFVTTPEDVSRLVWNDECQQNLAVYLTRKEARKLGRPAVVVKGCDARSVVVLANESQIDREAMVVIGMTCTGVRQKRSGGTDLETPAKCEVCVSHNPKYVDIVIGEAVEEQEFSESELATKGKYAKLAQLLAKPESERLAWWKNEFSRCIKCYACRQSCPLCYCNECVAEKNRPVRIDPSASSAGNFAWNVTRAFHLAGRCVGCGNCTSACPAGIDLDLLNLTCALAAQKEFGFVAGSEPGAAPLIGSWSEEDKEDFIR